MKHRYHQPPPSLTAYVRTVLVVEGFESDDSGGLPLVTEGMPVLICRTNRDQSGNENVTLLALCGTSAPPDYWKFTDTTTLVAYFFKPFALACMFRVAANNLLRSPIDLRNWSPHRAVALITQLTYATSTHDKIDILNNLLTKQLEQNIRECEIVRYATDHIMYDSGTEILSSILKKLNLNERTFQRIFKKYVGVTPNQYRRICQFQLSFAHLRTGKFDTLSDLAYDNGFADQSHFIRSFREFTGTTPNTYLHNGLKDKKS